MRFRGIVLMWGKISPALKAPAHISPGQRPRLDAAFFLRAPKGRAESIIMPQSLAKHLIHLVSSTSHLEFDESHLWD